MVEKVAVYIRWSTEDQGEGTTLEVQLEACRAYVLSQGWHFDPDLVFVDDGISGATMDRPALGRLRAAVAAGRVDCVVVYKLDRLSRSVLDMLKLVLEEWQERCHVKSAREPIDTMTPTGRMFFYQLMSFAEWERAVIRDRMFAGKLRRAQEGKDPGIGVPYGYVKGPGGAMQVDPATGPVVQRIFRLYLSGLGARSICRVLHEAGILSPAGSSWTQATVSGVLKNPAYTGVLWYGKRVTRGEKRVRAPEPLVLRDGFFPPLISPEEFAAAQRLRTERPSVGKGGGRAVASRHLLTGVLRCGACGHAMVARRFGRGRYTYSYYSCWAVHSRGAHGCGAGAVRQEQLDDLVARELLARFRGARERVVQVLVRENESRHREAAVAAALARQELQRLRAAERRLKGQAIDGRLSPEEYRGLQSALNVRLAGARQALERAGLAEERAGEAVAADVQHMELLGRIDEWETLGPVERKQLLRQFVSAVKAFRSRSARDVACEVVWRWGAM